MHFSKHPSQNTDASKFVWLKQDFFATRPGSIDVNRRPNTFVDQFSIENNF